jgi:hypothetical protein
VRCGTGILDVREADKLEKWKKKICDALSASRTTYKGDSNPSAIVQFLDEDHNYILCAFEIHPRHLVSIDVGDSLITSDAYPFDGASLKLDLEEAWHEHALAHSNGSRKAEGIHSHQLRVGPWTLYDSNGRKFAEGEYYFGVKVGEWRYWDGDSAEPRLVDYGHPIDEAEREVVVRLEEPTGGRKGGGGKGGMNRFRYP